MPVELVTSMNWGKGTSPRADADDVRAFELLDFSRSVDAVIEDFGFDESPAGAWGAAGRQRNRTRNQRIGSEIVAVTNLHVPETKSLTKLSLKIRFGHPYWPTVPRRAPIRPIHRAITNGRLSARISFTLLLPGWLQPHGLIDVTQLFLHLLVLFVLLDFVLCVSGAPRLAVHGA